MKVEQIYTGCLAQGHDEARSWYSVPAPIGTRTDARHAGAGL